MKTITNVRWRHLNDPAPRRAVGVILAAASWALVALVASLVVLIAMAL
jgi:hypothetical protein